MAILKRESQHVAFSGDNNGIAQCVEGDSPFVEVSRSRDARERRTRTIRAQIA